MSIYYPEFVEHGIMRISDLYMENGIIPWRELALSELSPIFKLKWIGILHAIPENLKNIDDYMYIHVDDVCMNISGIATPIEDITKHKLKSELIDRKFTKPSSEKKLERDLGVGLLQWHKMY